MPIRGTIEYTRKKRELKVTYDPKTFEPCHAKEVEEWSHKQLKRIKYIVHVREDGRINRKKLSS